MSSPAGKTISPEQCVEVEIEHLHAVITTQAAEIQEFMDERGIITDERDLYEKKLKALTLAMGSTENQNIDLEKKVNGMEHTIECAIEAVRSLLKTVDLCNKYVPNPLYGHIRILITTFNANFSKMMPEGELPAEQPATSD